MKKLIFTTVMATALVAACGGAAPEARAPDNAGSAPSSQESTPQKQYAQPPPPQPSSIAPTQPQPQPGATPDAWLEFQSAHGEFDATTSDCAVACKALASIDRATGHVCAMTVSSDHCGTARDTLKSARRKVHAECNICPGGPTTDPDGPIPSVP